MTKWTNYKKSSHLYYLLKNRQDALLTNNNELIYEIIAIT